MKNEEKSQSSTAESDQAYIERLARYESHKLAKLICEATLGIMSEDRNPFTEADPKIRAVDEGYNSDLARMMLARINGTNHKGSGEYASLADLIAENPPRPSGVPLDGYGGIKPSHVPWGFFQDHYEEFNVILRVQCELALHGTPFFERSADDPDKFIPVPFDDEEYTYLAQRAKNDDQYRTGRLPAWASRFYVKREHLKAYALFLHNDAIYGPEAEALIAAFHNHIGIKPIKSGKQAANKAGHSTRLLGLVHQVISRYYGAQFDIEDSDTWPKQSTIVEWLRSEHGLSQREAEAIDIISRPDRIRGK